MGELLAKYATFFTEMKEIIFKARNEAVRSVEYSRMMMYWHLGERIFVEEQRSQDRADYGEHLIKNLAKELEGEFGSGFSYTQLTRARKFYRLYPIVTIIKDPMYLEFLGLKREAEYYESRK